MCKCFYLSDRHRRCLRSSPWSAPCPSLAAAPKKKNHQEKGIKPNPGTRSGIKGKRRNFLASGRAATSSCRNIRASRARAALPLAEAEKASGQSRASPRLSPAVQNSGRVWFSSPPGIALRRHSPSPGPPQVEGTGSGEVCLGSSGSESREGRLRLGRS